MDYDSEDHGPQVVVIATKEKNEKLLREKYKVAPEPDRNPTEE